MFDEKIPRLRWIRKALEREDVPHPCWHAERLYPSTISFKIHQFPAIRLFATSSVPAEQRLRPPRGPRTVFVRGSGHARGSRTSRPFLASRVVP